MLETWSWAGHAGLEHRPRFHPVGLLSDVILTFVTGTGQGERRRFGVRARDRLGHFSQTLFPNFSLAKTAGNPDHEMGVLAIKNAIKGGSSVKSRWLITAGLAVSLALSACSGGGQPSSQSTPSGSAAVAPTATTAPPSPTTAPTVAPTPTQAPQPTTAPTNTPATQQQASGPAVGTGDIKTMLQAWGNAKTFRMNVESKEEDSPGTVVVEFVRPDRAHIKANVQDETVDMIEIGQDIYVNVDGKWTKMSLQSSPAAAMIPNPQTTEDAINKSLQEGNSLTKGGVSAVDGQPCQEWVYKSKDSNESGTVCVGLASNLPLQIKTSDGKVTMKFSDWNAPITIEPPM